MYRGHEDPKNMVEKWRLLFYAGEKVKVEENTPEGNLIHFAEGIICPRFGFGEDVVWIFNNKVGVWKDYACSAEDVGNGKKRIELVEKVKE